MVRFLLAVTLCLVAGIARGQARNAPKAVDWPKPIQHEQILITPISATLEKVKSEVSGKQVDCLIIRIQIENLSKTKRVRFTSWQILREHHRLAPVSVRDNHDNDYQRIDASDATDKKLEPGGKLIDEIYVERPIEAASTIHIYLDPLAIDSLKYPGPYWRLKTGDLTANK